MKLSIVIPCYNEGANVALIINEYAKIIKRDDIEVIIVDNGSTDGTAAVISELLAQHSRFLRTYHVPVNQGYGFGILSGLSIAKGDFIGWTHGDMQTAPSDIIRALELIEANGSEEKLYLKGVRYGRPLFDRLFTWGMNVFESLYMGTVLYDINAQPNIFHRNFFSTWKNPPHDFSLDLYALYKAKREGQKIMRFPVSFPKRVHGNSSWNTGLSAKWKFIKRTLDFSVKLKKSLS